MSYPVLDNVSLIHAGADYQIFGRMIFMYIQKRDDGTLWVPKLIEAEGIIGDAIEAIKRNTRRYAKRQVTWFRHQTNAHEIAIHHDVVQEVMSIWLDPTRP